MCRPNRPLSNKVCFLPPVALMSQTVTHVKSLRTLSYFLRQSQTHFYKLAFSQPVAVDVFAIPCCFYMMFLYDVFAIPCVVFI